MAGLDACLRQGADIIVNTCLLYTSDVYKRQGQITRAIPTNRERIEIVIYSALIRFILFSPRFQARAARKGRFHFVFYYKKEVGQPL